MKFPSILVLMSMLLGIIYASTSAQRIGWSPDTGYVKPGECPVPASGAECPPVGYPCTSDCECSNQQKCCYQEGCGSSCVDPVNAPEIDPIHTCDDEAVIPSTKPGICPKPNPNMYCIWCYNQCTSDCECEGHQKCCPQPGCGYTCRDVV